MKQTAIQKTIEMVRKRIESMNDTLMGKHTAHHLQQVERDLHLLLKDEQQQIEDAFDIGLGNGFDYGFIEDIPTYETGEKYYKENYGKDA